MRDVSTTVYSRRWCGICSGLLLCSVVAVGLFTQLGAGLTPPGSRERQVALKVVDFLSRQHLSRRPIDDTTSQRALQLFLDSFDPMKVYFTQADVDEFK